jgi:two-component system NarL family sensor kinase
LQKGILRWSLPPNRDNKNGETTLKKLYLLRMNWTLNQSYLVKLLIAAWIFVPQSVFSQNTLKTRLDSVISTLKQKPYEEKKDAFSFVNKLISRYGSEKFEEYYKYVLSKDSSDVAKLVLYFPFAQRMSRMGNTNASLNLKLAGLEVAEKLNDERNIIIYNIAIANVYLYQNQPDKALVYLNKAEPVASKPEHIDLLWNYHYNMALLENQLGNTEMETTHYVQMWELAKGLDNTSQKRFILYLLVDHFSQIDKPIQLAEYTEILAQLYEEAHPNTPKGHMPIKSIFENRANPKNIPRLKESIRISDSLNSINSMAFSSIALAETYLKINQPNQAISVLKEAEQKLQNVDKPQILTYIYSKLIESSIASNNYKEAFQYLSLESGVKDSLRSERMQRNIAELQVKFDTEKKEREIVEQNLIIEKEGRQKQQITIGLIALGILLILSFIFFRKRLNYQKTISEQTEAIQKQKITELQQKNKLLAMNSMIEGQEAERLRIAKDLHDSLGGLLSTVKAHFTTIQKEIEQLEKLNITEKTNDLIDEACLEVRRISHNMMPHSLSISGLKGAIEDLGDHLNEEGLSTTVEVSNLPDTIETTRKVMIYRLAQEIISNIRKHAAAKNVLIQLMGYDDEITLIIEDDGKGFDYNKALEKGGLGLKSINSRVQFLDGNINWDSALNMGTTITINIPRK